VAAHVTALLAILAALTGTQLAAFDDPCGPGDLVGVVVAIDHSEVYVRHGWRLYALTRGAADPVGWACGGDR
jgi:hypothetical protein